MCTVGELIQLENLLLAVLLIILYTKVPATGKYQDTNWTNRKTYRQTDAIYLSKIFISLQVMQKL